MNYDSRLRRLEAERCADPQPIRMLVEFVDPDPAVGVVSVLAMAAGQDRQWFYRGDGETKDDLFRRARETLGWPAPAEKSR